MSTAATNLFKYGPLKDDLKDHLAMVQREIHRLEASAVAPSGEAALVERFEYKPVILLRERAELVPEESWGQSPSAPEDPTRREQPSLLLRARTS